MKLFLLSLVLLSGCASNPLYTVAEKQVEGWPQDMKITVHENAGFWKVQEKCWGFLPWYRKALGSVVYQCTVANLPENTCDIYTIFGGASEHELSHCKGVDHDGALQEYYNRWKGSCVVDC